MFSNNQERKFNPLKNQQGFSLLEILIALILLAGAGTFVAGKIFDQFHEGRVESTKIQMSSLAARLKEFNRHCNRYPTTEQGLEALIEKPTSGPECKRYNPGGYIDGGVLPNDPWDTPYYYESDGRKFNITSFGGDGVEGGEEKDQDISLYEKKD